MTTPTTPDLLKYADLQMAAEAFLATAAGVVRSDLQDALTDGNKHASKFTVPQATRFLEFWTVERQLPNTKTGFSGTVFKCIKDDPTTGAVVGEKVISFRSTEFVDDFARDNQATNSLEIKDTGFAWGQLRDMEDWYQKLLLDGTLAKGAFSVTGYSLGGHLASAFNEMHPREAKQVVTFNGAGIGGHSPDKTLLALVTEFTTQSRTNQAGTFVNSTLSAVYGRARDAVKAGGTISSAERATLGNLTAAANDGRQRHAA